MIEIDKLSYSYGEKKVLEDISVHFQKGAFTSIIGPNGSGKTTLLKLAARLLSPEKKTVTIDNRFVEDYATVELAKKIAYVPQRQDIVFDFPVFDTVMMGRNPYQKRWEIWNEQDEKIVSEVLEQTNLIHLKDRMLTQLSGGEMQRVLIARAMAQQTPVILLDEPLSNLDISHKYEIMDILKELNRSRGATILIILHDFSVALQYTAETLFLKNGKIEWFGPTGQVLIPGNIKLLFDLGIEYEVIKKGENILIEKEINTR